MKISTNFNPQQPNIEFRIRFFPVCLYQKLKGVAEINHISISSLIIQCCEFALDSMKGEPHE